MSKSEKIPMQIIIKKKEKNWCILITIHWKDNIYIKNLLELVSLTEIRKTVYT